MTEQEKRAREIRKNLKHPLHIARYAAELEDLLGAERARKLDYAKDWSAAVSHVGRLKIRVEALLALSAAASRGGYLALESAHKMIDELRTKTWLE